MSPVELASITLKEAGSNRCKVDVDMELMRRKNALEQHKTKKILSNFYKIQPYI